MAHTLDHDAHQRSLKDFLQLYNTITEFCFNKCVSNFNERWASGKETTCVDTCTQNYIQYNQRFMFNFVDHQERRKSDQESLALEAAKKQEVLQAQEAAAALASPASDVTAVEGNSTQQIADSGNNVSTEQMQKAAQLLESLSIEGTSASLPAGSLSGQPASPSPLQQPLPQKDSVSS